ncbi:MAG: tail fiber domain-containing protein [Verrucomicrobiota bacterium]|nr:tail fiber domain-containing protein [Chthoniobacterales bacterium]MDQ3414467.1 tail fiber domain-containing protein [Verrucomicrobiota bacterium]
MKLTTGTDNTAVGFEALLNNTIGSENTANGSQALFSNTTGSRNTATGWQALFSSTTSSQNTAYGYQAMLSNTTGSNNTATGGAALYSNTTGYLNTGTGGGALANNTTGYNNTAVGQAALLLNTTGRENTAIGSAAGLNITTGNYNIDIGNNGHAGDNRTIRIGTNQQFNTYIAGISGRMVAAGVGVIVDTNGHLGTVVSSARHKDAIKSMDKASEAILSLNPVTFRYRKALDPIGIPQFGLVAEEVAKVNPDLVARDEKGQPYTVRYEAVNAMLLNEFLKEHRKGEQQDSKIEQLEATVVSLQSELKAQAAQVQKVSDQLAASKTAPPMLVNNQ